MKTAVSENQKISIQEKPQPTLQEYGGKGAIVKVLGYCKISSRRSS